MYMFATIINCPLEYYLVFDLCDCPCCSPVQTLWQTACQSHVVLELCGAVFDVEKTGVVLAVLLHARVHV